MELIFDTRLPADPRAAVWAEWPMTYDQRQRSRTVALWVGDDTARLMVPRGTILRDGDLLRAREDGRLLRVVADHEDVLTAWADEPFALLRAAYHLGNRHVPVELTPHHLRLAPDAVLADMLRQLGLHVAPESAPFEPEPGAYHGHEHGHAHAAAPGLRRNHLHGH